MKTRRHHNNKGARKVRRGKTFDEVRRIARRLKVPFAPKRHAGFDCNNTEPYSSITKEPY